MLYFIYGSKSYGKNELKKVRGALLKKRPDALSFRFDEESADTMNVDELTEGRGLFEERFLVEMDHVFSSKVLSLDKDMLTKLRDSENIFFVLEEKLLKKDLDLLKKYSEKTVEEKAVAATTKKFSAFYLADALGERSKQRLWILLREAIYRGYALEEIHGILFWQAKVIILAHKTSSATEAGISQFPYSKAKQFAKNYTLREAEELLHALTQALIISREKGISLEHTLERVTLDL